jgi:hypothetical protein
MRERTPNRVSDPDSGAGREIGWIDDSDELDETDSDSERPSRSPSRAPEILLPGRYDRRAG